MQLIEGNHCPVFFFQSSSSKTLIPIVSSMDSFKRKLSESAQGVDTCVRQEDVILVAGDSSQRDPLELQPAETSLFAQTRDVTYRPNISDFLLERLPMVKEKMSVTPMFIAVHSPCKSPAGYDCLGCPLCANCCDDKDLDFEMFEDKPEFYLIESQIIQEHLPIPPSACSNEAKQFQPFRNGSSGRSEFRPLQERKRCCNIPLSKWDEECGYDINEAHKYYHHKLTRSQVYHCLCFFTLCTSLSLSFILSFRLYTHTAPF